MRALHHRPVGAAEDAVALVLQDELHRVFLALGVDEDYAHVPVAGTWTRRRRRRRRRNRGEGRVSTIPGGPKVAPEVHSTVERFYQIVFLFGLVSLLVVLTLSVNGFDPCD